MLPNDDAIDSDITWIYNAALRYIKQDVSFFMAIKIPTAIQL